MKNFYFGAAITMMMLCGNALTAQQRITQEQIQPVLDKLKMYGEQNPSGAVPVDKLTAQEAALFHSYQQQRAQETNHALHNPYGITDEEMKVKITHEQVAPILAKIDQLGNSALHFPEEKFTREEMKTLRIYELQNAAPTKRGAANKLINKAYALNARSTPKGFGTLTLTPPIAFTQLATNSANTIYADDVAGDGKLYALEQAARTLVTVNNSGVVTTVVALSGIPATETLSGLSWNSANSTMYVLGNGNLYTLNMTTGAATLVGATGLTLPIWLEIDNAGNAYTMDISTDSLYSVNLTTGVATLIGPTGVNTNFAQEADFNRDTNVLYMAAYTGGGGGGIYTLNTTTGVATLVGDTTPLNAEFTMFSITNSAEPINKTYDLRGYPNDPANFGTSTLTAPGTQTLIGNLPTQIFADDIAGDGILYALKNDTKQLVRINQAGTMGIVGPLTGIPGGDNVTGLSWDRTTGKMYAISIGSFPKLYTINLATGAPTFVANITNSTIPIWLEIDNAGIAYMADVQDDNLYTLNLTTGVATLVGPLGIDINFAQEADINTSNNQLYMAAFLSDFSNGVYSVNTSTGAATLVGATANEITMFSIADSLVNYLAVDNVNTNKTNIYPNPTTGILNIGASGKIDSVEVFDMVGQKVMSSNPKSERAVLDMSALSKGVYMIKASVNGKVTSNKVIKK